MRQNTSLVRRHLDAKLTRLRHSALSTKPSAGWIRAIRQSLGMSTAQLGARMGVSQPRVTMLEHGEAAGSITLKTLQRAAEALNCTLVYALVPNEPLEHMVRARARQVAAEHQAIAEHTMALEDQRVPAAARKEQLAEAAAALVSNGSRALWRRR
jgi:predicted DNA-binding mobile mystery protein A